MLLWRMMLKLTLKYMDVVGGSGWAEDGSADGGSGSGGGGGVFD
jgi:hypothetical protein